MFRGDAHIELEALVPRRANHDPMGTGIDVQLLEDPVEVVDDADEVAVDVDLGLARLDLQLERSLVARCVGGLRIRGIPPVPRIVEAAVVPAVAVSGPVPVAPRIVVAIAIAAV